MAVHYIPQDRRTLHGHFSNKLEPIIEIDDGDTVIGNVMDGDWHLSKPPHPNSFSGNFFAPKDAELDSGHALIGPIYIKGADPGSVLSVQVNRLIPANWGWSRVGGVKNDHTERLGIDDKEEYFLIWDIDNDSGLATSHLGHKVKIDPFLGVLAVEPKEEGIFSTHPPNYFGGNIDCNLLTPGSTVYLPISVKGALFSFGDGHAVQGDGELGGTAIECTMELVDLTLKIETEINIELPRANTPEGWVTFGFHENLTDALYGALNEMASLLQELFDINKKEALAIISVIGDARITQVVNGIRGVHVVVPHEKLLRSF